jgi:hypothetical protein
LINKKIAIIGSSPIMILLYFRLIKKNLIHVYENSGVGGAWKINSYKNVPYTPHNNVIVALSNEEEKYVKIINQELKNFNCKINKTKGKFEINKDYKPKNKYLHDLSNLYLNFLDNNKLIFKKKIDSIKVLKNQIYFNKNYYDHVFFPSCIDLKRIHLKKQSINLKRKKSISHHITIIYKLCKLPNISYTENFDNVFDRGYFKKTKRFIIFTGRVRRNFKKYPQRKLINFSKILKNTQKNIIKIKLNKYHHNIIEEDELNNIKLELKNKNISIVETRQFINSYIQLDKKIKL